VEVLAMKIIVPLLSLFVALALISSCANSIDSTVPTVETSAVMNIGLDTAECGGTITYDGGGTISARGVCWSTEPGPIIDDSFTSDGTGTGDFASNMSGLTDSTIYYVRAYATNSVGTGYGTEQVFVTSVEDYDGNIYHNVVIGDQVWMAENLRVTHYRDGTLIPNVTDSGVWSSFIDVAPPGPDPGTRFDGYVSYNNDPTNITTYGLLYNWWVITTDELRLTGQFQSTYYNSPVAPEGWHVPTDAEWKTLEMYLGMTQSQADADDAGWNRGYHEGSMLREVGYEHWQEYPPPDPLDIDPMVPATDDYGFTGLPSGYRYFNGTFYAITQYTYFWSASAFDSSNSYCRGLIYTSNRILRDHQPNRHGYAIRCVRD
jgi:uncharacterized protein (TIGR02145 family)